MMRFSSLDKTVQTLLQIASVSAKNYRHSQVNVEHLLLILIKEPDDTIAQIGKEIPIDFEKAKDRLDLFLRSKSKSILFGPKNTVFVSAKVKRILDKSEAEARGLGDKDVLTEHVLLSVLREAPTTAAQVFSETNATYENVIETVKRIREKHIQKD